jgi:hypothetical protein
MSSINALRLARAMGASPKAIQAAAANDAYVALTNLGYHRGVAEATFDPAVRRMHQANPHALQLKHGRHGSAGTAASSNDMCLIRRNPCLQQKLTA